MYQRHRISLEILANLAALPTTGAYILCGGHINKNGAGFDRADLRGDPARPLISLLSESHTVLGAYHHP